MTADIRIATTLDAPALQSLNRCFNEVDTPVDWMKRALANDGTRETVLLASVGEQAVGFGCLRITHSVCYVTPVGEITELFVLPNWRRKGIGRQIIMRLVGEALARGVSELSVIANAQNAAAKALYGACGFVGTGDALFRMKQPNDRR